MSRQFFTFVILFPILLISLAFFQNRLQMKPDPVVIAATYPLISLNIDTLMSTDKLVQFCVIPFIPTLPVIFHIKKLTLINRKYQSFGQKTRFCLIKIRKGV